MSRLDDIEREVKERPPAPIALRPAPALPAVADRRPAHLPRLTLAAAIARALDERRLFVLLPFAVIAGLLVSLAGSEQPTPWVLAAIGATLLLALPAVWRTNMALRAVVLALAFWAGLCLFALHGALFGTTMLARPAYGTFEMRVDEVLSEAEGEQRLIVSAITAPAGTRQVPMRRARLLVRNGPTLAPGDVIAAPVRFYAVPGPVLPSGFDTQFHSYFHGIGAYGNTTGAVRIVRPGDPGAPERLINDIRQTIAVRADRALAQPAAGIARALINGDQSAVTTEARDTMATAGLAHVLSVSGLHLTLVAGGVFVALRLMLSLWGSLARYVSTKRVAAAGGILVALFYYAISGGNVAALRSTIMIVLVFGAVIVGRRALTMRNVAIAGLLVIASDPASVLRPSFQLSFAAVVALIGAWEGPRRARSKERSLPARFVSYFGGIAATSLVASAATLLFSVYHFQQTSPLGVLGNLLSLPLVGFVMMPAAVLASLAMPFGIEGPFFAAMGWSIDRMLDLAAFISGLSNGLDMSPLLSPIALILGLAALAWFAFLTGWHRLIGPVLLVPAVLLFGLDRPPDVLIADTTQAVVLRFDDGLKVVAGKPGTFALTVWADTYAETLEPRPIACDSVACVATGAGGFRFALVKEPGGFVEECDADLVVTRRNAPAYCAAGTVVDAQDLAAGGVHWLAWNAASRTFEVRPAVPDRNRPWRPRL